MDELKEAGTQALLGIIESVTTTANFLKGEIPIAVKELLTYYTALYSWYVLLGLVFVVLGYLFFRYMRSESCLKHFPDSHWLDFDKGNVRCCSWFPLGVGSFIGVIQFCSSLPALLKITLAPRIWLIEYAANLVR